MTNTSMIQRRLCLKIPEGLPCESRGNKYHVPGHGNYRLSEGVLISKIRLYDVFSRKPILGFLVGQLASTHSGANRGVDA